MAEEIEDAVAAKEPAKGGASGIPMMPLLMAMMMTVVLVLGAGGGGLWWLAKSGRLAMPGAVPRVEAATIKPEVKTKLVTLDPLLVNLADSDGAGYLRVAIVLRVEDPPPAKDEKPKEEKPPEKGKPVVTESDVMLRDAALAVLGRATSGALLAEDGKERLKDQLRDALKARVPAVHVVDVMFTDFLVQR